VEIGEAGLAIGKLKVGFREGKMGKAVGQSVTVTSAEVGGSVLKLKRDVVLILEGLYEGFFVGFNEAGFFEGTVGFVGDEASGIKESITEGNIEG
jgi:hypothetical protein